MTREIVINGRFLSRRVTGVERYGREIIRFIGDRCRVEVTRKNGVAGHAWEQFVLPTRLFWSQPARWRTRQRESILWSPANTGPLLVRNQALTIHDLSPLEHPEWFEGSFALWYRLFLPILSKRVRMVFAPSEYVKRKVMARFGINHVIVTPIGVDNTIFHPCARQNQYALPKKYILFVGSIQPRKNLNCLIQAWQKIKDEFTDTWLVIAGTTGHVFHSVKLVNDERVHFLNYVPEKNLPALYANAELFALPSFDEGFGLPALEAMACGVPVLVSNGGALPEVVGDAGFIFDLSKPDTLSASIRQCLCNDELRSALKEKGLARAQTFSSQKSADLIWNTLNEI